jgi:type II secretory pathway pseudopilin PulG
MPGAGHLPPCLPQRQRGVALLVMLVVLIIGLAAILVGSLSKQTVHIQQDQKTAAALAQAKAALIGYAITYAETHTSSPQVDGYLPCPDLSGTAGSTGEGSSNTCGSRDVSSLGRLPWKTLDLEPLRDGYGECLWYAVSGTYKNNPKTGLMNWDTGGLLQVSDANGNTVADVVAVIFAPGPALAGQDRTPSGTAPLCGGNYTAGNYLDNDGTHNNALVSATANAGSSFYSGSSSLLNDRLIYITRQDIWSAMLKRRDFLNTLSGMTQQVASCIAWYGRNNSNHENLSLPWPAPLSLADYTVDTNYDDAAGWYAGRIPYNVYNSKLTSNNQMYGYYLLPPAPVFNSCPGWNAGYYAWWTNWKDHLFYALSREYQPAPYWYETNSCGTCVLANGHGPYAAVVMFAGQALPGQNRADKSVLSAYLEGRNASNYPNSGGNANYQVGAVSNTFNDVLYCIDQNLNVAACPQ